MTIPGAIDELGHISGVGRHVGDDQGQQRHRLAGARGHLQEAVTCAIFSLFKQPLRIVSLKKKSSKSIARGQTTFLAF